MNEKLNEIAKGSFLRVNEEGKAYWGQSEGGGGSGLPTGGAPYQQLVTDGEGNAKWDDRLAYDDSKLVVGPLGDGSILVKVADEIPDFVSAGEVVNVYLSLGNIQQCEIRDLDFDPNTGASVPYAAEGYAVFVAEDNQIVSFGGNDLTFPQKGVYFFCLENAFYMSGVSSSTSETPEITWDGSLGGIKKIDEKFLPELTMTSPNGTKYKLTVSDDGTLSAVAQS